MQLAVMQRAWEIDPEVQLHIDFPRDVPPHFREKGMMDLINVMGGKPLESRYMVVNDWRKWKQDVDYPDNLVLISIPSVRVPSPNASILILL